jgi:hypothetical protein
MSSATVETPPAPARRRPVWALPAVVVAVLAVAAALVVGIGGLLRDPVVATAPDGTASISGTWEPVECSAGCVQGYVQAGARSVFVRLPRDCAAPAREAQVSLRGRPDAALGKHAYAAEGCPAG